MSAEADASAQTVYLGRRQRLLLPQSGLLTVWPQSDVTDKLHAGAPDAASPAWGPASNLPGIGSNRAATATQESRSTLY